MIGRVVSTKLKNTATVLVERTATHPLYKKTYIQSKKYLVDNSIGVKLGDIVDFVNCKPISKRKSWKIIKILGKNFAAIAESELKKGAEAIISEVMPQPEADRPLDEEEKEEGKGESGKGEEEKTERSEISEGTKKVKFGKRSSRKEDKQEGKGK